MVSNINILIFRDNEQLSKYGDTKSARGIMLGELKKLIEANPLFRDKLTFPNLKNSRLRTLINQRFIFFQSQSLSYNLRYSFFVEIHFVVLQLELAAPALQESKA